jgi:hypothetical protein
MKNIFKLFGIAVLITVIGFSMAACGDPDPADEETEPAFYYSGKFAKQGGGDVTFEIQDAASYNRAAAITLSGKLQDGSLIVTISGTYDTVTFEFTVTANTSATERYTISGKVDSNGTAAEAPTAKAETKQGNNWNATHTTTVTEQPVNITGPATDPGPGTGPGTDPGTDPGTNPGTGPGTDPGTDPGTNPGTDPGTDPGTNPGPGTDPGTNPGGIPQSILGNWYYTDEDDTITITISQSSMSWSMGGVSATCPIIEIISSTANSVDFIAQVTVHHASAVDPEAGSGQQTQVTEWTTTEYAKFRMTLNSANSLTVALGEPFDTVAQAKAANQLETWATFTR